MLLILLPTKQFLAWIKWQEFVRTVSSILSRVLGWVRGGDFCNMPWAHAFNNDGHSDKKVRSAPLPFLAGKWSPLSAHGTLSRIIKRQVLTNSMVAILTFWSTTDSDHVRVVPVALLSITINHSGARFWPQKEKTSASTFFHFFFFGVTLEGLVKGSRSYCEGSL